MAADGGSAVVFGDFDGDGYEDMAVGAPGDSEAAFDAGAVNVIYRSAGGLTHSGDQLWRQDTSGVFDWAEQGDHFGAALAVGDFDGV